MADRMNLLCIRAKAALHNFFADEKGAVDLVTIVVLIAIAIVLAFFFREQIKGVLDTIFGGIRDNAAKANDSVTRWVVPIL